jgi:putative acetyltransferase
MERVIVDIDNTLWDLATPFYERIKVLNPAIPPPSNWKQWGFLRDYLPDSVLFGTIDEIHREQDRFLPYPDAPAFLRGLKSSGFHVVVASLRKDASREATERWLRAHGMVFDELHLLLDKSILFEGSWALVDDIAVTLGRASAEGLLVVGLKHPWNETGDHPVFPTLSDVLSYLLETYLESVEVRKETPEDLRAISAVIEEAFGRPEEARLVDALRKTTAFVPELSLVAARNGRVLGHVLFHPVTVESAAGSHPALALAPLAVGPECQKRGVGAKLVSVGMERAAALRHGSVIVVGDPEYYGRFGFQPAAPWGIRAPFDVPDAAFMALELKEGTLDSVSGIVHYPEAFNTV